MLMILPDRLKCSYSLIHKQLETLSLVPFQQLDHFLCKFELSIFKPQIASRRGLEHKPKINMDLMPTAIDQNVSIVPVFDL